MMNSCPKTSLRYFLVHNNQGFVAPARNMSKQELHSEISYCTDLLTDAQKSCKEIEKMSSKSTRRKPEKQHIVYPYYLFKDDEQLSKNQFKIF